MEYCWWQPVSVRTHRNPTKTDFSKRGTQRLTKAKVPGCEPSRGMVQPLTPMPGRTPALLPPGQLQAQAQHGGNPISSRSDLIPQEVTQARMASP